MALVLDTGLCGHCLHARIIRNRRGTVFFLCGRSRIDPRYARYPRLPVLACPGHDEGAPQETAGESPPE